MMCLNTGEFVKRTIKKPGKLKDYIPGGSKKRA